MDHCYVMHTHIGFTVDIKIKTALPIGFKRKIKHEDITSRIGDAQPSNNSTSSETSKPAKKVTHFTSIFPYLLINAY